MKYKIILADCPWSYHNYNYSVTKDGARAKRGVVKEYNTMDIDNIRHLPVADIAADDCVLFLWSTPPLLPEALSVIRWWGFKYITKAFCWVKTNPKSGTYFWGMGQWSRANTEDCLLAIKGKPKRVSASVHQIITAPVGKHSHKPDIIRDKIVELCGDIPRIELFAREQAPGWDALGYDIDGLDIRDSLKKIIDG